MAARFSKLLFDVSYLEDTSYPEAVVGPPAATEELEQEALVASYLEKVTPEIASEFEV